MDLTSMTKSTSDPLRSSENSAIVLVEWPIVKNLLVMDAVQPQAFRTIPGYYGAAILENDNNPLLAHARCEHCRTRTTLRQFAVEKHFKVGDSVSWNSEAGRVRGRIIKVHSKDVDYKGYTHHAGKGEPQYEIKSDKTDHIAMHKGSALRKLSAK